MSWTLKLHNLIAGGVVVVSTLFGGCTGGSHPRLLAVGGIHAFDSEVPCRVAHTDPEGMFKNLEWPSTLALEAMGEGNAEVECGGERIGLKVVAPARMEIDLLAAGKHAGVTVNERFKVQARLYDRQGNELEVGKFTIIEWTASDVFQIANDRSAGEFGLSDTAFGMHNFRAVRSGKGSITARLGSLQGELIVIAGLS